MAPRSKVVNEWAEVAKEIAKDAGTGGLVQYLKAGETLVKFCVPAGAAKQSFFTRLNDIDMKGVERIAYLVSCVIVEVQGEETNDLNVKYVKVTKTLMDAIIDDLQKGWDFLSPEGECFLMEKLSKKPWYRGGGLRNSSFDSSKAIFPETSITQAAVDEANAVLERSTGKGKKSDDDEAPF